MIYGRTSCGTYLVTQLSHSKSIHTTKRASKSALRAYKNHIETCIGSVSSPCKLVSTIKLKDS